MFSLVSLLVAAALISQHSGFEANAQRDNSVRKLDNNLLPRVTVKRGKVIGDFLRMSSPPEPIVKRLPGERTVLECRIMGNPPPAIRWMRNGVTIQDFEDEVNEILDLSHPGMFGMVSRLVVSSGTRGEDKYSCVATNGNLVKVANSIVYTVESDDDEENLLSLQTLPPTITYYYDMVMQTQGYMVLLPCRVASDVKTQIFWQDTNDRIIYGNPRMKVLSSGDLLINDLVWEDKGNFTCIAKNMYGKDVVSTFIYPFKNND